MRRLPLALVSAGLLASAAAQAQNPNYPYAQDPNQGYPPPGYAQPGVNGTQPGYAPAPPPGYAAPGYPPTAYAAPGPLPPGGYVGPDGLTYVGGAPVYFVDGAYVPLLFVAGLGWGYYGYGHRWFGAPLALRARLDRFYPGGRGFHGGPGFRGPDRFGGARGFERR